MTKELQEFAILSSLIKCIVEICTDHHVEYMNLIKPMLKRKITLEKSLKPEEILLLRLEEISKEIMDRFQMDMKIIIPTQ